MDNDSFDKVANMEPEILDMLVDRVCMPLKEFSKYYSHADYCEIVMPFCQQIEENPRAVNSVIAKLKERKEYVDINMSIRRYHQLLTVVYVVLYYCYRQDPLSKLVVFPQLKRNMGIYDSDQEQQDLIQKELDAIIQEEALLNQRKDILRRARLSGSVKMLSAISEHLQRELFSSGKEEDTPRQTGGELVGGSSHGDKAVDCIQNSIGHEVLAENGIQNGNDDVQPISTGRGFTCGQYACLLFAAAQLIDPEATKTALIKLFAKVTGYSEANFNRKIMGEFSETDKKAVADLLQDVLPHWAEKIRKL